jgi:ubiquinone/menaquinone biosynthesis C-methylase UbiE
MVRQARAVAPTACFMAAAAESLPVGNRSIDLMTAAGSLAGLISPDPSLQSAAC